MEIHIIAFGHKLPAWMNIAVETYLKRLRGFYRIKLTELPIAKRSKTQALQKALQTEGDKMLAAIHPEAAVIALDVAGQTLSTNSLAKELEDCKLTHTKLCLLIGGPDGLSESCLKRADKRWSLSSMTFPHGLARVMIAEQLYRAQSILAGHPYHRE